jgi:hypothetical protein
VANAGRKKTTGSRTKVDGAGRLAGLVASMPSWISLALDQTNWISRPPGTGSTSTRPPINSSQRSDARGQGAGVPAGEKRQYLFSFK